MAITDTFVLPSDVMLIPIGDLPSDVRTQIEGENEDWAVTRLRSRTPSRIIDTESATLLKEFRSPKTIIEAVINYSRGRQRDPEQTLVDAFPLLQRLMHSRLLVSSESQEARQITPSYEIGAQINGFKVIRCIQVLEDTELYHVKDAQDKEAALKLFRLSNDRTQSMLEREATILKRLDGDPSPKLVEVGTYESHRYIAIEWCSGVNASTAAAPLRRYPTPERHQKLLRLICSILQAYCRLQARQVIHSDVHPGNILIADDGSAKIIDFGLARLVDGTDDGNEVQRGGVAFFFEPEYAKAAIEDKKIPESSMAGEQYAVAALLYFLLTGVHYLDFSLEKNEMLRQIAEESPLSFSIRGKDSWPDVEELLFRALSKHPKDRFSSLAEFSREMSKITIAEQQSPLMMGWEASSARFRASETLLKTTLKRLGPAGSLLSSGLTRAPTCSVNFGAAGIAYALYRIACIQDDASLISLADIWATKAMHDSESAIAFYDAELDITPEKAGQVSLYHSVSGVHYVRALIAHAMGDIGTLLEAIEAFISASTAPCENLDLTLGRSGILLACSLLLDTLPESTSLLQFGGKMMRGIWDEINTLPPIQQERRLRYLGIAHGWAGILYAAMRWCQWSGDDLPGTFEERLQQIVECTQQSGWGFFGNRKYEERSHEHARDLAPSWCNGSAGFIHLWTLAHHLFGTQAYLDLAEKAARSVWEDISEIDNLCCGYTGRAYALLNMYKYTGKKDWLYKAQELTSRATRSSATPSPLEDSLYKGKIGVAVLIADLSKPEESCMPIFESEGWTHV